VGYDWLNQRVKLVNLRRLAIPALDVKPYVRTLHRPIEFTVEAFMATFSDSVFDTQPSARSRAHMHQDFTIS
jgi:hypothetical protein